MMQQHSDSNISVPARWALRLLSLSLVFAAGGCVSSSDSRFDLAEGAWGLIGADLDHRHLANRGDLPLFDRVQRGQESRRATMSGGMTVAANGSVVFQVAATEPTAGRPFVYSMLNFNGRLEDDGRTIVPVRAPEAVRLGQPTVLHILGYEQDKRVVLVQGATGDRMLPYVYRFRSASSQKVKVPAPAP